MEAFGDECKYLQITGEECLDINGIEVVRLKGILFDVIKSAGRVIIDVVKCDWLQTGSKEVLVEFLVDKDPWKKAANALCDAMGESIPDLSHLHDISACLGTGANGRVFNLSDKSEQNILLSSVVFPQRMVPFLYVEYAGYKLAFEGKKIATPTTDAIKTQLAAALFQLHNNNVDHGVDRKTWQRERCANSLGGDMNPRAGGAIDAYARKPMLEGLINIIVGMT
eukprot:gene35027-45344_t